ncbi:MFS transporter [Virgibacillus siamensis]|uniref:MFS transporter n=1 Tax=Virgibacillus siamensis TaxID=480071 RepID=UPI0009874854|nr:MFS transporter [Virgibacillus siamensis]
MKRDKGKKNEKNLKRKKKSELTEDDITVVDKDVAKKAVVATGIGNAMEWFDFGIYSYLAATIGKIFFPEMEGSTQLVFSFATFSVAFLVRPLGGMFFGSLGDKIGRKKVLAMTLILMAFATLSIGLIPTYSSIGLTAPILLLAARLIQGFSTGGEYSGAMTFIAESTPDSRRGVMSSGLEVGTLIGYIGGSGIVTLLTFLLGSETMLDWGWRIPFLIAAPIGVIGFYLRTHLEESPAFEKMEQQKEASEDESRHVPLKDLVLYHRKALLMGLILVLFYNVIDYTILTYMPSHLTAVLGYGQTKGLLLILIVMFIMIPIVFLMGHFGDRIGNKRIIQSSLIGFILLAVPSFMLINSNVTAWVFIGIMIMAILLAALMGTMPSQLPSLFFTEVRYGGLAITYNISVSLFGGTAPLVVSWLVDISGSNLAPAFYVIFVALIGIVVVSLFLTKTSGKPLRGSPPAIAAEENLLEAIDDTNEELWWTDEKDRIDKEKNNNDDNQTQ